MPLDPGAVRAAIADIDAAFDGLEPPGDERLLHPQCMDDGDVVEFYGAVDRRDLTDAIIIGSYAAPSFFSAEAFQYYMPAFMIWSLTHADSIEFAPESTISAFDPFGTDPTLYDFQVSKYVLFTAAQRDAVIRFLETFASDPDLGPIAQAALDTYWRQQS